MRHSCRSVCERDLGEYLSSIFFFLKASAKDEERLGISNWWNQPPLRLMAQIIWASSLLGPSISNH